MGLMCCWAWGDGVEMSHGSGGGEGARSIGGNGNAAGGHVGEARHDAGAVVLGIGVNGEFGASRWGGRSG